MSGTTIRIVLLVCVTLLAACGQVATPMVTPRPAADVSAAATLETTAEVAAAPTVEPTEEATVEPVVEPTEEVVIEATVEPTEEVATEEAVAEPTEEATVEAVTEPTEEATAEADAEATEAASGEDAAAVDPESVGDPVAGQQLFVTGALSAGAPACNTCHIADSEQQLVGPGMLNVAERAASRVPELSAVEYLHQSIADPAAHVVEGFVAGMMPDVYDTAFTEEQINDLVAYLLTLEG